MTIAARGAAAHPDETARDAGARYERAALAYLTRAGLALVASNYHCRFGEIDLVMRERDVVVFVEVRYRRSRGYGGGVNSVDASKRAKLVRAATAFLADRPRLADATCRFDVLAIAGTPDAPTFDWRRNAFEAC
jgi:putative endonuclease